VKLVRAGFLVVLVCAQAIAQTSDPTISKVDIDGRKVRIRVAGSGSPTVVFESGFGGDTLNVAPANYRMSLQMDPSNRNTAEWIAKLEGKKP
jgi:hypothetical protein